MSNLANGRVNVKFNNSVLVQINFSSLYSNFILSLYIVYQLNNCPRNPTNNFHLKNCLFGTLKLVRNAIKSKFTYNGRGIAFEGLRSFGTDFASNVVIFGVDNSSSSHTNNKSYNFLVLGEEPTAGINGSIGAAERKFSINFSKGKDKMLLKFTL